MLHSVQMLRGWVWARGNRTNPTLHLATAVFAFPEREIFLRSPRAQSDAHRSKDWNKNRHVQTERSHLPKTHPKTKSCVQSAREVEWRDYWPNWEDHKNGPECSRTGRGGEDCGRPSLWSGTETLYLWICSSRPDSDTEVWHSSCLEKSFYIRVFQFSMFLLVLWFEVQTILWLDLMFKSRNTAIIKDLRLQKQHLFLLIIPLKLITNQSSNVKCKQCKINRLEGWN